MDSAHSEIESGGLWLSVLDALDANVALLAADGRVLALNRAWRNFAEATGGNAAALLGVNYLDLCDGARGWSSEGAAEIAAGLRALLENRTSAFVHTYACHSPDQKRWFRLRATRVDHDIVRVLMIHTDETPRERACRMLRHRFRSLSPRELDVLRLIVRGLSNREIAEALGLSHNTIESHRRFIMTKTGAGNAADLVRMAVHGEVIDVHSADTAGAE